MILYWSSCRWITIDAQRMKIQFELYNDGSIWFAEVKMDSKPTACRTIFYPTTSGSPTERAYDLSAARYLIGLVWFRTGQQMSQGVWHWSVGTHLLLNNTGSTGRSWSRRLDFRLTCTLKQIRLLAKKIRQRGGLIYEGKCHLTLSEHSRWTGQTPTARPRIQPVGR